MSFYTFQGENVIKLSWSQANKREFVGTMVQLHNTPKLEVKTAYRISRIFEGCRTAMDKALVMEKELRLKYAKKSEAGELLKDEQGDVIVDEAHKEAFDKEMKDVLDGNFIELKVHKLAVSELTPAGLSPAQILAVEPLLDGLEELDKA